MIVLAVVVCLVLIAIPLVKLALAGTAFIKDEDTPQGPPFGGN